MPGVVPDFRKRLGIAHAAVGQARLLEQVIHDGPDLLRRHVAGIGAKVEIAALGLEIAELAQELPTPIVAAVAAPTVLRNVLLFGR